MDICLQATSDYKFGNVNSFSYASFIDIKLISNCRNVIKEDFIFSAIYSNIITAFRLFGSSSSNKSANNRNDLYGKICRDCRGIDLADKNNCGECYCTRKKQFVYHGNNACNLFSY